MQKNLSDSFIMNLEWTMDRFWYNDEVSQPHVHGNEKKSSRPFIRTKSRSQEKWLKQNISEDPNVVYKKKRSLKKKCKET